MIKLRSNPKFYMEVTFWLKLWSRHEFVLQLKHEVS